MIQNKIATALGADLFCDYIPDEPNKCISLIEYDSTANGLRGITTNVRYVQVTCRSTDATEAKQMADSVYHLFLGDSQDDIPDMFTDLPSGRYALIVPKQSPFKIRTDTQQRVIYGFNNAITTQID